LQQGLIKFCITTCYIRKAGTGFLLNRSQSLAQKPIILLNDSFLKGGADPVTGIRASK